MTEKYFKVVFRVFFFFFFFNFLAMPNTWDLSSQTRN